MTGCPTSHSIGTNMDCGWLRLASWNKNGVLLVNIVCEHIFNSWGHASVPRVIAGTRICKFLWECALFAAPPTDSEFSLWQIFYSTVRGLDCFLNYVPTSWRYSFVDFFLLQIDLLYGISVAVGRRFREECDSDSLWQGLFQKEDIIQLTKLVKTKSGGSLYTKIAEEQAAIQVSASTVLKLPDQCNSGQTIDGQVPGKLLLQN